MTRRLAVIVSYPWFRAGRAWDSYVRYFVDLDGKSAEEHFLDWWNALSEASFTKQSATVRLFWIEEIRLLPPSNIRELTGGLS